MEKIYYNALNIIFEANYTTLSRLKKKFGTYQKAYQNLSLFPSNKKYLKNFKKINPQKEYEKLKKLNVSLILEKDKEYPFLLGKIQNKPLGIYYKSKLKPFQIFNNNFVLSIVGSRKTTLYGREVAKKISYEISNLGGLIISGLALGIDTNAHLGALEAGGKTIAVLAGGLDKIYPPSNRTLSEKIQRNGALISEYPLNTPFLPHHFVLRNRIISGLSLGVVVVEASQKSGALTTANLAIEQGREVFSVPGNIFSSQSIGTNQLIQKGAKLILNTKDIIDEIKTQVELDFNFLETRENNFENKIQEKIFSLLKERQTPLEIEKIAEILNISLEQALTEASLLELNGLLKSIGGRWQAIK